MQIEPSLYLRSVNTESDFLVTQYLNMRTVRPAMWIFAFVHIWWSELFPCISACVNTPVAAHSSRQAAVRPPRRVRQTTRRSACRHTSLKTDPPLNGFGSCRLSPGERGGEAAWKHDATVVAEGRRSEEVNLRRLLIQPRPRPLSK